MGQVISFINMKGGVGKTTLSVNVAYALAYHHEKKVLLVDGDPQFNALTYLMNDTDYLRHIQDLKKRTIFDIFMPKKPGAVNTVKGASSSRSTKFSLAACTCQIYNDTRNNGQLDLIPSTLNLIEIETSKRGTENRLHHFLNEKCGHTIMLLLTARQRYRSLHRPRFWPARNTLFH